MMRGDDMDLEDGEIEDDLGNVGRYVEIISPHENAMQSNFSSGSSFYSSPSRKCAKRRNFKKAFTIKRRNHPSRSNSSREPCERRIVVSSSRMEVSCQPIKSKKRKKSSNSRSEYSSLLSQYKDVKSQLRELSPSPYSSRVSSGGNWQAKRRSTERNVYADTGSPDVIDLISDEEGSDEDIIELRKIALESALKNQLALESNGDIKNEPFNIEDECFVIVDSVCSSPEVSAPTSPLLPSEAPPFSNVSAPLSSDEVKTDSIEEDADIMRATLLSSLTRKEKEREEQLRLTLEPPEQLFHSPPLSVQIKKQQTSKGAVGSNQIPLVMPTIKQKRLIIRVGGDSSDSDYEQENSKPKVDSVAANSDGGRSADVEKFLRDMRIKFEANQAKKRLKAVGESTSQEFNNSKEAGEKPADAPMLNETLNNLAIYDSNTLRKQILDIKLKRYKQLLLQNMLKIRLEEAATKMLQKQIDGRREQQTLARQKVTQLKEQLTAAERVVEANDLVIAESQSKLETVRSKLTLRQSERQKIEQRCRQAERLLRTSENTNVTLTVVARKRRNSLNKTGPSPSKMSRVEATPGASVEGEKERLQNLKNEIAAKLKAVRAAITNGQEKTKRIEGNIAIKSKQCLVSQSELDRAPKSAVLRDIVKEYKRRSNSSLDNSKGADDVKGDVISLSSEKNQSGKSRKINQLNRYARCPDCFKFLCRCRVERSATFNVYSSELIAFRSYMLSTECSADWSKATFANRVDPKRQFCAFDLFGDCRDASCKDQHFAHVILDKVDMASQLLLLFPNALGSSPGCVKEWLERRGASEAGLIDLVKERLKEMHGVFVVSTTLKSKAGECLEQRTQPDTLPRTEAEIIEN